MVTPKCAIDPFSKIYAASNFANFLVLILFIFLYSLHIAFFFDFEENYLFMTAMRCITLISILTNIYLNLNSGYYLKGTIEKRRKKIYNHYKKEMIIDFIILIPIIYNYFDSSRQLVTILIEILFFLSFFRISKI